ncbi:molybdopterin-synthase adenylyltransferase [Ventosimonas gracilis]|uniref:Molybdopterin-synthase adenylyltransferase n=1 Tax=Ventosimonas gracilis TaxID=1680762 RepID=A0A139SI33_9GAMM|nr:molybdopterin-synthase adenylyltransferase MoeB [Ventosimonas gracilis]KXU34238.1 molybdopterin-synthase adenylyltransferase [Ventosimonas gracilis]
MLSDNELLRYSRQLLLPELDAAGQLKLKQSRVLIAGLGGLGSPVALYLAAAGVGEIHLCDFDCIELSNLARQILYDSAAIGQHKTEAAVARLARLNPGIKLHPHRVQLDNDNLKERIHAVDLVLDCTDNFAVREAINSACVAARKPLISGAAIGLNGQLALFDLRKAESPCYHCLYGSGEDEAIGCNEAGVLGPLLGVIGSLQALEALKLLAGLGEPFAGRLLLFDALTGRFRELKVARDALCLVCGRPHAH